MLEEALMRKAIREEVLEALRPFMEFVTAQFAIVHENHLALVKRVERLELAVEVVKADTAELKYDMKRLDKRVEKLELKNHYA